MSIVAVTVRLPVLLCALGVLLVHPTTLRASHWHRHRALSRSNEGKLHHAMVNLGLLKNPSELAEDEKLLQAVRRIPQAQLDTCYLPTGKADLRDAKLSLTDLAVLSLEELKEWQYIYNLDQSKVDELMKVFLTNMKGLLALLLECVKRPADERSKFGISSTIFMVDKDTPKLV